MHSPSGRLCHNLQHASLTPFQPANVFGDAVGHFAGNHLSAAVLVLSRKDTAWTSRGHKRSKCGISLITWDINTGRTQKHASRLGLPAHAVAQGLTGTWLTGHAFFKMIKHKLRLALQNHAILRRPAAFVQSPEDCLRGRWNSIGNAPIPSPRSALRRPVNK